MLAMVVPNIALYINGKLSLSGYEESYQMDVIMISRLTEALEIVRNMENRDVNYSMIRNLVGKIEVLMMDDVVDWTKEIEKLSIKSL